MFAVVWWRLAWRALRNSVTAKKRPVVLQTCVKKLMNAAFDVLCQGAALASWHVTCLSSFFYFKSNPNCENEPTNHRVFLQWKKKKWPVCLDGVRNCTADFPGGGLKMERNGHKSVSSFGSTRKSTRDPSCLWKCCMLLSNEQIRLIQCDWLFIACEAFCVV